MIEIDISREKDLCHLRSPFWATPDHESIVGLKTLPIGEVHPHLLDRRIRVGVEQEDGRLPEQAVLALPIPSGV
ncbi:MAG: hypothetical protein IPN01_28405 [Deltaproteobacteria bacterium]|nr:hypothetical protein [Deltaproteobacteria bacterium]